MNRTQEDIDLRNLRVFGTPQPAQPEALPDEPRKHEALIEQECCKMLAENGWRTLKTDPVSNRGRGKGFGELGMADTLCLRYSRQEPPACEVLWLEWKSRTGRVKKHQLEWHAKERARGAVTAIAGLDFAASVTGLWGWYRASGLAKVGW